MICDCERGHNGFGLATRECDCEERMAMTPDPEADAALDVWFGEWREYSVGTVAEWRTRMRRVLDAHDARKRAVAFADKAMESASGGVHSEEEMHAAMKATYTVRFPKERK